MAEFLAELHDFHFLRPLWLLVLLPLLVVLLALWRPGSSAGSWGRVCDAHLLPYLLQVQGRRGRGVLWLLGMGWLLAALALAGPVWTQRELPVMRSLAARVIVLDLSRSMDAADLKPSRIARARYKVADMLARTTEGQTGLVVFAGDAFAVAPLTRDAATLNALVAVLEPALMPVQGSRADLGLRKARELLEQAGITHGEILLMTDEADTRAALVAENLAAAGFPVSVLAVGTEEGAPIPQADGFLKDASGTVVIPRLDVLALRDLARNGGGRFAPISVDATDLDTLLAGSEQRLAADTERVEREAAIWREEGPWLVLVLLPLAALAFRRGWLLGLALVLVPAVLPPPAQALDWQDLWQRPDQQAARLLDEGANEQAAAVASDPWLRGTAHYQAGQYEQALSDFAQVPGAEGHYNRGNALARLERLEDALKAFDAALAADPNMADAQHNRAVVEELLKQQQAQQAKGQQDNEQKGQQDGEQQGQQGQQGQQSGQPGQQAGDQSGEQPGQSAENGQSDAAAQQEQQQKQEQEQAQAQAAAEAAKQAEQAEQAKQAEQAAAAQEDATDQGAEVEAEGPPVAEGGELDPEEQQALNQWLRRIPDDPGGLLRNKFYYQYQRAGGRRDPAEKEW